jgi:hypothetical protein
VCCWLRQRTIIASQRTRIGGGMPSDPMRVFVMHCGYWRVDANDLDGDELWSNGLEFIRLAVNEEGSVRYAVLEDRFDAELNLQDLLALLEFPVKKIA